MNEMPDFDPRGFIAKLLELADGCMDIDGGDFQEACQRFGILEERRLTAEQMADDDGLWHEYACMEGDLWLFKTSAYLAWAEQDASAEPAIDMTRDDGRP